VQGHRGKQQKSKNCSHWLPEPQRIALDHGSPPGLPGCCVQSTVLQGKDEFDRVGKTISGAGRDHSHEDMIKPRRKIRPQPPNGSGRSGETRFAERLDLAIPVLAGQHTK
jgi:hypothetical protein